jgi:hypothetical protein
VLERLDSQSLMLVRLFDFCRHQADQKSLVHRVRTLDREDVRSGRDVDEQRGASGRM